MSESADKRTERRPDKAAFVIAAGLLALSMLVLWDATRIGGNAGYSGIGPATVPNIIGICLLLLAVWTGFEAWRGDFPEREEQHFPPLVWIVGGLAAQMLLLTTAGFAIATGLLFAATAKAFGKGPLWKTVPIGILISLLVWVVFAKGLQLSLPAGPLERLF